MRGMPDVGFIDANGIRMAVYEAGSGIPVVLLHGWPELAYSWRHQVGPLVSAGYRVIVPDQRGYGLTDRPADVDKYDMANLTADMAGMLDALGVERAIFCGHDWGGFVAWHMPLMHGPRTAGVISVNTPFLPRLPVEPIAMLRFAFGDDMYVVRFQQAGAIDALLDANVERVFRNQMRAGLSGASASQATALPPRHRLEFLNKFERPDPAELPGKPLLTDEELAIFVTSFERTGFTGGINWYRNITRNWIASSAMRQQVDVPSLMISASDDVLLPPALTCGMEAYVPDLEKHVLAACGHWTQQEQPEALNSILIDWLHRRFPPQL